MTTHLLGLLAAVSVAGCLCVPHQVAFFDIEAPAASREITCYSPPFPPLRAIELSFGQVKLQVSDRMDHLSVFMCVPEGNFISINPHEIYVLSEKKVLLQALETYMIRTNDFSGRRDLTPEELMRFDGATRKVLGHEGHRKIELQAKVKQGRARIHYIQLPSIRVNGVKVDVPLLRLTERSSMSC